MIEVRHRTGSYRVEFGPLVALRRQIPKNTFIITDSNVASAHPGFLKGLNVWSFPAGEENKTLETYIAGLRWLAAQGARRDSTVIAFGGGVVGDMAGFISASYMRGVRLWQVPTTLLAQVDSSVGGKVGVDMAEGKNMAGAFYPPDRVYVALETLQTLPDEQFTNGMAEVWKYAFILDGEMMKVLEKYPLAKNSEHLQTMVERCIWLKAEVVEEDEQETKGRRAILNFGHTVGHALERVAEYRGLLHGQAVSIGMVAEAVLGEKFGVTPAGISEIVRERLEAQGLPVTDERLHDSERVMAAMRSDKKADREGLAFSLLTEIGGCRLVRGVPDALVKRTLQDL